MSAKVPYRVIVNVLIPQQYEIVIDAVDPVTAARAVMGNWETVYQRRARQIGAAPSRVEIERVEDV